MRPLIKRVAAIASALAVWFLIADGYWAHKERSVAECEIRFLATVIQGRGEFIDPRKHHTMLLFDWQQEASKWCGFVEGRGYYWPTLGGLAYWEILLLIPVIHRAI
jgi:hypothetical protein